MSGIHNHKETGQNWQRDNLNKKNKLLRIQYLAYITYIEAFKNPLKTDS